MLYFFNLVNVKFQKELDAATKLKVNPPLLSRTLFWFRWGAVVTWVTGFLYYFLIANTETPGHKVLAIFLVGWAVAFVIVAVLLRMSVAGGALKDGRVLGVVIAVVVTVIAWVLTYYGREWGASSRSPLDPDRRRPRDDHVHERVDDHLAAPEEDHRGDDGTAAPDRPPRPRSSRSGRGGRSSRRARTRGSRSHALLHGRGEPLPDFQHAR